MNLDEARAQRAEVAPPGANFKRDEWALAMSGGGYKAAAYHLGALIRINELAILPRLKRISSVSGGSIISAYLGLKWRDFIWNDGVAINFREMFALPFARFLNRVTIDRWSILQGLVLPGRSGAGVVKEYYERKLYGQATLQDLPDPARAPRFVINATNMRLNSLWRFSRPYAADYRVGEIKNPKFKLSEVVTASSAFPPFFCPMRLSLKDEALQPFANSDRAHAPFNEVAELGDGGIYDNLGLETVWKRHGVLLVSNAGDPLDEQEPAPTHWLPILRRALSMIHRHAENNRVGELMLRVELGQYTLAYFPLRPSAAFPNPCPLELSLAQSATAQAEKVRLRALPGPNLNRLVRHGYARADSALRSYLGFSAPPPGWPDLGIY